ncbi:hypothetical protein K2173_019943 [Erythroxylum novogranatense]|uniref:RING-type E3 ubiquitin transferase n=1 Tax=Erythroxylum novogranatense TaxID=1862640 RepID=A0AAV8U9V0_9ROSI|nr:hypothetical protein K2173_019943 [Erythroxylum novogranatense]
MSESKESRLVLEAAHPKMSRIQYQIKQRDGFLRYSPPLFPYAMSPYIRESTPSSPPSSSSSGTRISPAVLFVIVILAVLFFISGLLHLLVRFLIKHPSSSAESQSNRYPEISGSDALQRQLQQLFHLHDSGLDQAFIDALPVFQYKEIMGLKEPFDCAVCLCEFSEKDKLRLLPTCSHAFHINCIDTWLLSNSTCPLCRGALFTPGFPMENPIFDFDDFRDDEGCPGNPENGLTSTQKTVEIEEIIVDKEVLPVRLGKFRKLNDGTEEAGGESSSSNLDARRCFSMGSYQYVLGNSDLRVAFSNDRQRSDAKLPGNAYQSRNLSSPDGELEGKKISSMAKGESFSVSKIWLWSKKGKFSSSSDANHSIPSLNVELPWMSRTQDK